MSSKQQSHLLHRTVDLFNLHMLLPHQIGMELMRLQFVIADLVHLGLDLAHVCILLPYDFVSLGHLCQLEGGVVDVDQDGYDY